MSDDRRDPRYLGDGVYASHDGYQIWLRAERDGRVHEIALEPEVLAALATYHADIVKKYSEKPR
jgi:hypothetical protein